MKVSWKLKQNLIWLTSKYVFSLIFSDYTIILLNKSNKNTPYSVSLCLTRFLFQDFFFNYLLYCFHNLTLRIKQLKYAYYYVLCHHDFERCVCVLLTCDPILQNFTESEVQEYYN